LLVYYLIVVLYVSWEIVEGAPFFFSVVVFCCR